MTQFDRKVALFSMYNSVELKATESLRFTLTLQTQTVNDQQMSTSIKQSLHLGWDHGLMYDD